MFLVLERGSSFLTSRKHRGFWGRAGSSTDSVGGWHLGAEFLQRHLNSCQIYRNKCQHSQFLISLEWQTTWCISLFFFLSTTKKYNTFWLVWDVTRKEGDLRKMISVSGLMEDMQLRDPMSWAVRLTDSSLSHVAQTPWEPCGFKEVEHLGSSRAGPLCLLGSPVLACVSCTVNNVEIPLLSQPNEQEKPLVSVTLAAASCNFLTWRNAWNGSGC